MLIRYMPVYKADGSQVLDMQRNALLAAGVSAEHIYGCLNQNAPSDGVNWSLRLAEEGHLSGINTAPLFWSL